MNNEPSYFGLTNDHTWLSVDAEYYKKLKPTHRMKCYTHPVKEYKEPSVKEIDDLWLDVVNNIPANDHRPREWHFANAILRKAQEK